MGMVYVNNSTSYHSLNNKTVFITGGASGIGAAMVRAFVQQKAEVAFIDIDANAAQALAQELSGKCWYRMVDVTCPGDLQQAISDVATEFGGLDVLINNVANDMRHHPEEISVRDWHQCMQVNLDPAFFASQAAYNIMKRQGSGSIINFSSINALIGPENMTGYATAKAGLLGMTKALAHDFGGHNIRVNALLPGWVATDKQLAGWLSETVEKKWMESMALKKRINPQDVANLALFLASDDSAMISGQSIAIDGGKT
jgi:NAD(P)-dependent dehydrogenase (short-subunit alcohol dehydrogenase family)